MNHDIVNWAPDFKVGNYNQIVYKVANFCQKFLKYWFSSLKPKFMKRNKHMVIANTIIHGFETISTSVLKLANLEYTVECIVHYSGISYYNSLLWPIDKPSKSLLVNCTSFTIYLYYKSSEYVLSIFLFSVIKTFFLRYVFCTSYLLFE